MSELFSEAALVDGAVAGDMAALEQLLSVHFTALERHIAPKTSTEVRQQLGTEDILQEAFFATSRSSNAEKVRPSWRG